LIQGGWNRCHLPLLWLFMAMVASRVHAGEARPNIIVVLADQWRAQAFGFAGDRNAKTPHLDRLASEGVCFKNAIAGLSVCCPTRASLITGQRPLTHGVFFNDVPLRPDALSIAKVLGKAGYDTGYIGKWHLNGDGRSAFIPRERRQGFEYWKALECTHDYSNSFYYADGPERLKWFGYDAHAQTEDACAYLRDHARSLKPFLLFLAWGPPHDPYFSAPAEYRGQIDPAKFTLRPNVPLALEDDVRTILAGYYAHCAALDDCMGELLQTLQETELSGDTILVFTSDHGDMLGSHGQFKKQKPWDESIRVPLLIRWPKGLGTKARSLDALFNSEDLMPTLLGLARVTIPPSVEGLDYSSCLRGGLNPGDGASLIQCVAPFGEWERHVGGKEYRGIRTARYTYVQDLNGPWLLFDNERDPYQTNNLVNLPSQATLQIRLDAALRAKLRSCHDEFRPGADYVTQWGYQVDQNGTVPYTP
jgi:arylsulfatase A-like enzyme